MADKEVYRIEIPIEAEDKYSDGIDKAKRDVKDFEKTVDNSMKNSKRHTTEYERAVSNTVQKINNKMNKLTRGRWSVALRAVDRASHVIRRVSTFASRMTSRAYRFTIRAFDMATRPIRGMISSISSMLGTLGIVGGVAGGLVMPLKLVAERQDMESSFEVLLGSADKAKKRVQELTDFAQHGIFMRDDVFEASRLLEVFSDGAISTGDSLKLVGDIAAGTQQPIEDVALWMGRMYDSMESGRPFGEATRRLQEMGALSGSAREKLEELAGSGKDISKIWPEVTREFEKFNGLQEAMAGNLKNQFLFVWAFVQEDLMRPWGEGLSDSILPYLKRFSKWQADNRDIIEAWKNDVKEFATSFSGNILDGVYASIDYVNTNYLQNEEFQDLSFTGKVKFILDDVSTLFSDWWEKSGRDQVTGLSEKMGTAFGEVINGAIMGALGINSEDGNTFASAGFEAGGSFAKAFLDGFDAWEVTKEIGKKLLDINIGGVKDAATGKGFGGLIGAGFIDLLVLGTLTKILGGPLKGARGIGRVGKSVGGWMLGKFGKGSPGKQLPKGQAPSTQGKPPIYTQPWFNKGERTKPNIPNQHKTSKGFKIPKIPKPPKGVDKLLKRIPYIGTALGALSLIGTDKEDMAGSVGGMGGGILGGAAGGAIAGAAFGGVGAIPGAIIGGVAGAFGGEWIGDHWDDIKQVASDGLNWYKGRWSDNWETIKSGASSVSGWISEKFNEAKTSVSDLWGNFSNWFDETIWTPVSNAGINTINFIVGLWEMGREWVSGVWESFSTWFDEAVWSPIKIGAEATGLWINDKYTKAKEWVQETWSSFTTWFDETIWSPIKEGASLVGLWFLEKYTEAKTWVMEIWEPFSSWFEETVWTPVKMGAQIAGQWINDRYVEAKTWIQETWSIFSAWFDENVWTPVKSGATAAGEWFLEKYEEAKGGIQEAWAAVSGWFEENVWGPIKSGAELAAGAISSSFDSAKEAVTSAYDWAKDKWDQAKSWTAKIIEKGSQTTGLKPKKNAGGTNHHPGGLAIVGDGGGSELVQLPDGRAWLSPNQDTLVNMPRGTKVLPSNETRKVLDRTKTNVIPFPSERIIEQNNMTGQRYGIPQYAKGIGNIDFDPVENSANDFSVVGTSGSDVTINIGDTHVTVVIDGAGSMDPDELAEKVASKVAGIVADKVEQVSSNMPA